MHYGIPHLRKEIKRYPEARKPTKKEIEELTELRKLSDEELEKRDEEFLSWLLMSDEMEEEIKRIQLDEHEKAVS